VTKDKVKRDFPVILYDARINLQATIRYLNEAITKDYGTAEDDLGVILDLVEEAHNRLKLVGHDGRWLS
jgi:hypothetical protein